MNFDPSMHTLYDGSLFEPSKLFPDMTATYTPAPPEPRYVVMPHGRSLVAPVVTENGFGTVEYELERRHFTYRVPLNMMWMNSASPEALKSKQVIEYMLEKAWASGSRLSEKLHNIANIIRSIEDGMVQEEPE